MNRNLLNISGKISEPIVKIYDLIAETANNSKVRFFVIGATARDFVFEYGYNIKAPRATRDIDLAVQVATWDDFQSLKNALIATGCFANSKMMQRMYYYQNQIPIDIVPFGAIENEGSISWPQDDSVKMNVAGFNDAYHATQNVRLRESPALDIPVATPAALVILKLMAWMERSSEHSRDATDLAFLLRCYLEAGCIERFAEENSDLLDEDFELTGARILGRDIASIASVQTKQMLNKILNAETGEQKIYRLVEVMSGKYAVNKFEQNLKLLEALRHGLNEVWSPNTLNIKNDKNLPLATTDVLILCGGLGTRLQPVLADCPKGLAKVGGKPFLDILIDGLIKQGFQRIILCVGHLQAQFIAHYTNRNDAEFVFSSEETPLGTGGAIKNALPLTRSDPFLVVNGDSICPVDFAKFYAFHQSHSAIMSMVLTKTATDKNDTGTVRLNNNQQILSFAEKMAHQNNEACYINAGIYLIQKESFEHQQPPYPFSLEYDVFPELVATQPCFGFIVSSELLDIGTPERYEKANKYYRKP